MGVMGWVTTPKQAWNHWSRFKKKFIDFFQSAALWLVNWSGTVSSSTLIGWYWPIRWDEKGSPQKRYPGPRSFQGFCISNIQSTLLGIYIFFSRRDRDSEGVKLDCEKNRCQGLGCFNNGTCYNYVGKQIDFIVIFTKKNPFFTKAPLFIRLPNRMILG